MNRESRLDRRCPALRASATLLVAGAALAALGAPLRAGSVFMKNGYIIQGPIVERSDVSVILGWAHGKVTIHRRFIDTVSFDNEEEKRLKDDEEHRRREATRPDDPGQLSADVEDLPASLEQLMDLRGQGEAGAVTVVELGTGAEDPAGGPGAEAGDASPPPGTPPDSLSGAAVMVARPEQVLGDRVTDAEIGVSIQPPRGWQARSLPGALHASSPEGENGLFPSFNVVTVSRESLSGDEYLAFLKEENARTLKGFELLGEGPRDVGAEKGYEILGRGEHRGRTALVRQLLVVKGDRLWLVSAFSPPEKGAAVFPLLDESLRTFELLAR